jgi:hypothetical protein
VAASQGRVDDEAISKFNIRIVGGYYLFEVLLLFLFFLLDFKESFLLDDALAVALAAAATFRPACLGF